MKNKGNKGKLKKTFYIDYQLYTIFYFLLFIGFCSGSRYLIRIRHLGGFHFWVPFSFIHQLVAGDAIGDAKCKKLAPESLYSASGGYSI